MYLTSWKVCKGIYLTQIYVFLLCPSTHYFTITPKKEFCPESENEISLFLWIIEAFLGTKNQKCAISGSSIAILQGTLSTFTPFPPEGEGHTPAKEHWTSGWPHILMI